MLGVTCVIHRQVGGDAIKPRGELGLRPVAFPGAVDAQKNLLRHFFGNRLVTDHSKKEVNDGPMVLLHQEIKAGLVARRYPQHDRCVALWIQRGIHAGSGFEFGIRPCCRTHSQGRVVQDHGCHIFWNPVQAGRLRTLCTFLLVFMVGIDPRGTVGKRTVPLVRFGPGRL